MSTKPEETYRLAGGITVTDADLEADAQRFEVGEYDGAWKVLPERPMLSGIEPGQRAVHERSPRAAFGRPTSGRIRRVGGLES